MDFDLRPHTILLAVTGSRCYGIHTPDSDIDVKGVAIPPAAWYHGFVRHFEQADSPEHLAAFIDCFSAEEQAIIARTKLEGSVYELRKLLGLAIQANPNILDVLFCRDEEVRWCTPAGEKLRASANLFLSARAKHTFSGYATAQLKRIETHRRWLIDPPTTEPVRAAFGLPERTVIPADQLAAAESAVRQRLDQWEIGAGELSEPARIELQGRIAAHLASLELHADARWASAARSIGYDENFLLLLDRERRYKGARSNWEQFHRWKRERNPARAALEAHHGYDTKHGAHLYRLLKMAGEILTTGRVHVWRGDIDADEIRGIRAGAWPYERLIEWARAEDAALEILYREHRHVVPRVPDQAAADRLCVELIEDALRR